MRPNPCKECVPPKRYPGCHAKCEAYIEWKKEWDAVQKRIKEQQQFDNWGRPSKPVRKRH